MASKKPQSTDEFDDVKTLKATAEEFNDLLEQHKTSTLAILTKEKVKSLMPVLCILSRKPHKGSKPEIWVVAFATDFNEHDEKHALLRGIGRKVYESQHFPLAVCLSSEAWMSKFDNLEKLGKKAQPRDDPQRKEVVIVAALSVERDGGRNAYSFMDISRDEDGFIIPGQFEDMTGDGGGMESSLLESFYYGFWETIGKKYYDWKD